MLLPSLSSWSSQPVAASDWTQKRLHKVWRGTAQKVLFFLHMGKFCCLHLRVTRLKCRMISDLSKITVKPLYIGKLGAAQVHWSFFTPSGVCQEIHQLIYCVCINLTFLSTLWQSVNKLEEAGRTDYKILVKSCVGHHLAQNSNPSSVSYQLHGLR